MFQPRLITYLGSRGKKSQWLSGFYESVAPSCDDDRVLDQEFSALKLPTRSYKVPLVVEPCWPNLLNSKKTHWTNPEIQKSRNPLNIPIEQNPCIFDLEHGNSTLQCVLSRVTPLAGWARSARRKDPWLGSDVLDSLPSGNQTWLVNLPLISVLFPTN